MPRHLSSWTTRVCHPIHSKLSRPTCKPSGGIRHIHAKHVVVSSTLSPTEILLISSSINQTEVLIPWHIPDVNKLIWRAYTRGPGRKDVTDGRAYLGTAGTRLICNLTFTSNCSRKWCACKLPSSGEMSRQVKRSKHEVRFQRFLLCLYKSTSYLGLTQAI